MRYFRTIVSMLFLASLTLSGHVQANDYFKLSSQEKADLARYLGWVWGDGKPGNDGTGILYKGGNSRYAPTVRRLAEIRFDGQTNPLGFPVGGNLNLNRAWNYWDNSLPGGNPGDPEILREAIRHPNFLAGILEGEGQIFHSNPNSDFYVADQSYSPSHPDRIYDIANFGPERMIQLFLLLEETYGFKNPALSIGNTKYDYDTHRCVAIQKVRDEHRRRRNLNESGNLISGFTVRIHVKAPYFDEIRNYGYFEKNAGNYRTPAPDSGLRVIHSSFPDQNPEVTGPMTFFENDGRAGTRIRHETGQYLNSDLDIAALGNGDDNLWQLTELSSGYYRIESQDNRATKTALRAFDTNSIMLTGESSNWHQTQWQLIPAGNNSNRFFLRNRDSGAYLRVAGGANVEHGAPVAAQWTLENVASSCN